jgi:hypothetical protein
MMKEPAVLAGGCFLGMDHLICPYVLSTRVRYTSDGRYTSHFVRLQWKLPMRKSVLRA